MIWQLNQTWCIFLNRPTRSARHCKPTMAEEKRKCKKNPMRVYGGSCDSSCHCCAFALLLASLANAFSSSAIPFLSFAHILNCCYRCQLLLPLLFLLLQLRLGALLLLFYTERCTSRKRTRPLVLLRLEAEECALAY